MFWDRGDGFIVVELGGNDFGELGGGVRSREGFGGGSGRCGNGRLFNGSGCGSRRFRNGGSGGSLGFGLRGDWSGRGVLGTGAPAPEGEGSVSGGKLAKCDGAGDCNVPQGKCPTRRADGKPYRRCIALCMSDPSSREAPRSTLHITAKENVSFGGTGLLNSGRESSKGENERSLTGGTSGWRELEPYQLVKKLCPGGRGHGLDNSPARKHRGDLVGDSWVMTTEQSRRKEESLWPG